MSWDVRVGDALDVLRTLPDASVDAVVTDPPAGIAFMSAKWDNPWEYDITGHGFTDGANRVKSPAFQSGRNPMCRTCHKHKRGWKDTPGCECADPQFDEYDRHLEARDRFVGFLTEVLRECRRVMKPGAHAVIWALPRTSGWTHRAIEDAGLDVRDCLTHINGQSFPKSLNVAKQFPPDTDLAKQWDGWGTALKPAAEFWYLARKLLIGTVAVNVATHGTGALNIAATRVGTGDNLNGGAYSGDLRRRSEYTSTDDAPGSEPLCRLNRGIGEYEQPSGRWPPNVLLSHIPPDVYGNGGCVRTGTKRVKAHWSQPTRGTKAGSTVYGEYADAEQGKHVGYADADGTETVAAWDCEPNCPVRLLDEQAGERKTGGPQSGKRYDDQPAGWGGGTNSIRGEGDATRTVSGYTDQGGASRFFPTFEPDAVEWDCARDPETGVFVCPVALLDEQSGTSKSTGGAIATDNYFRLGAAGVTTPHVKGDPGYGDTGGCSRLFPIFEPDPAPLPVDEPGFVPFLYQSKSSRRERNAGLEGMPERQGGCLEGNTDPNNARKIGAHPDRPCAPTQNDHPTCKPVALMRWLCRLVTPPGGLILDPFLGSGTTGMAAVLEGFDFIGIDQDAHYVNDIARHRIAHVEQHGENWLKAARAAKPRQTTSIGKGVRRCSICGSQGAPHTYGNPWPTCGHDDWVWVKRHEFDPDTTGRSDGDATAVLRGDAAVAGSSPAAPPRLTTLPLFAVAGDD